MEAFRILVVDDDEGVRLAVCDLLTMLGYEAEAVGGAGEALDRFRSGRYHLVVTDLAMPGMNGLQLTRRLRSLDPTLPIMIFSASVGAAEPWLEVDGVGIVHKPDVEGLVRLVQRALEGVRWTRAQ